MPLVCCKYHPGIQRLLATGLASVLARRYPVGSANAFTPLARDAP